MPFVFFFRVHIFDTQSLLSYVSQVRNARMKYFGNLPVSHHVICADVVQTSPAQASRCTDPSHALLALTSPFA